MKRWKLFALILASTTLAYGGSRLYFVLTDGFAVANIVHGEFTPDAEWEVGERAEEIDAILTQEFHYLGKGCQSYVFESDDGKYVVKFLKYHRYRLKPWVHWFSFIPTVKDHADARLTHKRRKLQGIYRGWKTAYENLAAETGLLYVHLNPTTAQFAPISITDKMGSQHYLDLDNMQFLVQKKADMLCPTLSAMMENGDKNGAKLLLDDLLAMLLSEFERGFLDNDHALMQNTGVFEGKPMHVDVGQFARIDEAERLEQELFNKTYKFRVWLRKHYPELTEHFEASLHPVIGDPLFVMKPTHLAEAYPPLPRI